MDLFFLFIDISIPCTERKKVLAIRNLKTNSVSIMCYKVLLTKTINKLYEYESRKYSNINLTVILTNYK